MTLVALREERRRAPSLPPNPRHSTLDKVRVHGQDAKFLCAIWSACWWRSFFAP